MAKTHWKKLVNPDYIGAYSLEDGKDLVVKITDVKRQMVTSTGGKQEECTIAFLENQKPFIVNVTNAKTITQVVGSPYIEDWVGQSITLYQAVTKLKGEEVECLRVRAEKPITINLEEMKKFVVDYCEKDKSKRDGILSYYSLGRIDDLNNEQINVVYNRLK